MLTTFKSAASGDVMMFEVNAKELLNVLGKDPNADKGIVTVEQLPGAIAALRAAVEADRSTKLQQSDIDENADQPPNGGIRLGQRALPLLELLERALVDKVPVTWGV